MVFSSIPVYLDPPNWQQLQPNQQPGAGGDQNPQLVPIQVAPPPSGGGAGAPGGGGGCMGSIKPRSMADRARVAKISQPEAGLKCPRCESTNTKFCYFNNYSLTQPRHFCKTCRRYWTRGGALRNVPVGGGCRRNKRSKGNSRSKSPAKRGSSSSSGLASNSCTTDIIGHMPPPPPQLQILQHLHHIGDYHSTDVGLNFGGIQSPAAATASRNSGMQFHVGNSSGGGGSILSAGLVEQWRLQQVQQQFPLLAGLDPSTGVYSFEGTAEGIQPPNYVRHQLRSSKLMNSSGTGFDHDQLSNVKMEENHQAAGLNLSRNFLSTSTNDHHQYWGGNAWSDLPGFSSSSASQLL